MDVTDKLLKPKLLIVDDEPDIVRALTRVLRRDFDISAFTDPQEALAFLAEHPVPVLLSDMRMPQMDGAEFFALARELCPDSIRILLTGFADIDATARAINEGGVYGYLSKPWDNEHLRLVLRQAQEHYQLSHEKARLSDLLEAKNRELELINQSLEEKVTQRTTELRDSYTRLQKTMHSRSALFKDVLSLITTLIAQRIESDAQDIERVSHQSRMVAIELGLSDTLIQHTYLSALMHKLGLISGEFERPLGQNFTQSHIAPSSNPVMAASLIEQLSRFRSLAENVRHQDENVDGTGYPDHLKLDDIPVISRIIRVVKDYDFLVTSKDPSRIKSPESAIRYLTEHCGTIYDCEVVTAFRKVLRDHPKDDLHDIEYCVSVNKLKAGDVIRRDLVLPNGTVMLTKGVELTVPVLEKLKAYERDNRTTLAYFI